MRSALATALLVQLTNSNTDAAFAMSKLARRQHKPHQMVTSEELAERYLRNKQEPVKPASELIAEVKLAPVATSTDPTEPSKVTLQQNGESKLIF